MQATIRQPHSDCICHNQPCYVSLSYLSPRAMSDLRTYRLGRYPSCQRQDEPKR
jgi:hypothetical protein